MILRWTIRISLVLFLFGSLATAYKAHSTRSEFARLGHAVPVDRIGDLYEKTERRSYRRHSTESESTRGMVSFTTQDGRPVSVQRDLPERIVKQIVAGEAIYIRYLPMEPRNTQFEGDSSGVGFMLAIALGSLLWLVWDLKPKRHATRL